MNKSVMFIFASNHTQFILVAYMEACTLKVHSCTSESICLGMAFLANVLFGLVFSRSLLLILLQYSHLFPVRES